MCRPPRPIIPSTTFLSICSSPLALFFPLSTTLPPRFHRGYSSVANFSFLGEEYAIEGGEYADEEEKREGGVVCEEDEGGEDGDDGPAMHGCAVHVFEHLDDGRSSGCCGVVSCKATLGIVWYVVAWKTDMCLCVNDSLDSSGMGHLSLSLRDFGFLHLILLFFFFTEYFFFHRSVKYSTRRETMLLDRQFGHLVVFRRIIE
jgi:hypothetical protein